MKKLFALLVSVLLLVTTIPLGAVSVSAATPRVLSETEFVNKLNELRSTYPNGGTYSGTYYENGTAKAWTCFGYACQMFYEVFGVQFYADGYRWKTDYTMGTIYAGDWVRLDAGLGADTHSVFVTKVTSDRIYFTDANYNNKNGIRWDASYTKEDFAKRFTYKVHIPGNTLTGTGTSTPSTPIEYATIDTGTYSIVNRGTGRYLCVSEGKDANKQNVAVGVADGSVAQQFEITPSTTTAGYMIRPLCSTSRVVNAYSNTVSSGINVCLWDNVDEYTESQRWNFEAVDGGYVIRNVQAPSCVLTVDNSNNVIVQTYTGADSQIWTLESVENSRPAYDANAAVAYAAAHWNDGVGKCATFVSNCLAAGGCNAWSSLVSDLRSQLINSNWGTEYVLTKSGSAIYQSANAGKLSAGDPIFYYCTRCNGWMHTVFCSGFDSAGKATAYAHNVAWNNVNYLGAFEDASGHTGSDIIAYSFHMSNTHNHSYDTYVYYEAEHPHYKCYQCACGEVKANTEETVYLETCEYCKPVCNHTYDGVCDPECNECGEWRNATAHQCVVTEIEATCSTYGKKCYTCIVCGYYYEEIIADDASDWSVEYPSNVEPELVESKVEYRYREWMETTEPLTEDGWILDSTYTRLGDYGAWSGWTDTALSGNDTTQVETRTVYPYYYFKCPNCGAHMHVYLGCYTWAGGCGKSGISSGDYVQIDSTVSYSAAGVKDFHGTGRNYAYLDGQLVFQHRDGSKTQYRSRTKEMETVYRYYRYTDWAEWSEECSAPDAMTEERTVYRYVIADLADHTYDDDYDADCNVCGVLREVPEKPTPDLPADAPAFTVDNVTAREGEEVTVAVRTERNSGIVSLNLVLSYDADVLELVAIDGGDFANAVFSPLTNNPVTVNWVDAIHPDNTTDGVVALLTFRVKDGAPIGKTDITLTYDAEDVYDQNFDNVAFRVENGGVEIVEYTPGDVNGDGKINNKDLGLLQQYLADWGVEVDLPACDVTADGKVNNKDLGRLQQYLADWDVELG